MTEAWKKWEGQEVNGEFFLRRYLGESDHSSVFLTERGKQNPQKAAIKLVPADPGSAQLNFSRWRAAAKLSHPHLLRLYETGRWQMGNLGLLYVVMEYAEEDLSQILPRRALTAGEAQEMLKPVLDALGYVHGLGFVHGHLKPSNILAAGDQLKISSDGLCVVGEPRAKSGKPTAYDPPEAASGKISPAGDVWSLGMTLAEVLTQRLPEGDGREQAEPRLPETMPEPYLDIARHCLRRDPQRRWTIADITARLDPSARAAEQPSPARQQESSPKLGYVIATIAAVLVLAVVVTGSRLLGHHAQPSQPSTAQPTAARPASHAIEEPKPQPKPAPNRESAEKSKAIERSDMNEKKSPVAAAPAPAPPKPDTKPMAAKGNIVHQVLPNPSEKAMDSIQGAVRVNVRVHVDSAGSVARADFDSPGPSKYFANLAMQAAQGWKFEPPTVNGGKAASEWVLRFEFTNTGTKAIPVEAAP
jgi:TonB family protein